MMRIDLATKLWLAIMDAHTAAADLAEEGNSGEFHDPEDADRLERKNSQAFLNLRNTFLNTVGRFPVLVRKEGLSESDKQNFGKACEWRLVSLEKLRTPEGRQLLFGDIEIRSYFGFCTPLKNEGPIK